MTSNLPRRWRLDGPSLLLGLALAIPIAWTIRVTTIPEPIIIRTEVEVPVPGAREVSRHLTPRGDTLVCTIIPQGEAK